jgi:tripartite-type tricarboxylate transporter receptor subunit TctC
MAWHWSVHPDLTVHSVREFVDYVKAHPGQMITLSPGSTRAVIGIEFARKGAVVVQGRHLWFGTLCHSNETAWDKVGNSPLIQSDFDPPTHCN